MHKASLLICFAICCLGTLVYANAPTITSFTPSTGPIGTVVTVTGTYLAAVPTVKVNGAPATVNVNVTAIAITIAPGTTTGKISVTTPDGTATSATDFIVTQPSTQPPTINAISAQVMAAASVKTVNFTVQDVDSPANSLLVTATSSNTILLQNAKILSTQTGNSRVLTITPEAGKFGSSTITVTVSDGGGLSASSSFLLTVNSAQPDISLRPSTVPSYAGVGLYSLNGTNQTVSQSVANTYPAAYYVHVQNKGNVADTFKITGTKAPTGWTVVYKINNSSGTDITADVTGVGWITPVVNPNATVTVAVYVTPGSTLLAYAATTLKMTAASVTNSTQQDVALLVTSVAVVYRPDISLRPSAVTTYSGMGVYNLTGANQTVSQGVAKNVKATYYVHVQNNGNVSDTFIITGTAASAGWTYDYKDYSTGTSIISAVTGAGWNTPLLKPGALVTLAVYATPDATVAGGALATQKVTATSSANPAQQDVGLLQTTYSLVGTPSTNPTDGAAMVWVPGGSFTMGTEFYAWWDVPYTQQVTLSGYWIYKYEVTVAQYRAFCSATSRALPPWPGNIYSWSGKTGWADVALQQHPIVDVTWYDAKAYADWAGVHLPTEAQWEYAARGPQGRNYPWGGTATAADPYNGWDQTKCANGYNSHAVGISTWPVGSFPSGVSWCGAQDLAGNAWEWCADWYGTYSSSPVTNPTGPATGDGRVWRGGEWNYYFGEVSYRGAYRYSDNPGYWDISIGFRCVSVSPGP